MELLDSLCLRKYVVQAGLLGWVGSHRTQRECDSLVRLPHRGTKTVTSEMEGLEFETPGAWDEPLGSVSGQILVLDVNPGTTSSLVMGDL